MWKLSIYLIGDYGCEERSEVKSKGDSYACK
mgnify:CR=1 FL=1